MCNPLLVATGVACRRTSAGGENDLADVIAAFHPAMGLGGPCERIDAVDDGLEAALGDVRPDGAGELVRDQRLERRRAGTQRRAGEGQPAGAVRS